MHLGPVVTVACELSRSMRPVMGSTRATYKCLPVYLSTDALLRLVVQVNVRLNLKLQLS